MIEAPPMFTTLITPAALADQPSDAALVVVDVRHDLARPERWGEDQYRAAHIPGARFAHIDRDLSAPKTGSNGRHPLPAPAVAAALFGRLGIAPGTQVVAYDQGNGMFASRLWWMLRWLGHDAVAVLDGGFERWTREGHPVSVDVPPPAQATFVAGAVRPTASAAEIERALAGTALTLVDARVPERYRGDVEPLDPVAGHIPGARNRPFPGNVNTDGTFKAADVLRREFAALLGATPPERVVHYCGSGVTGCHNVLAMEIAGLTGTRLYPGSWSEWCADSSRPVATGGEPAAR
jgi:thiosulfate/3-mercaptopyruvate sulfurtransferase